MGWPVYTETFVRATGSGGWTWVCPAGKRAVVTSVTCVNASASGRNMSVSIAGYLVVRFAPLAANTSQPQTLRSVCYAGEDVTAFPGGTDMWIVVSGYLFDDAAGALAAVEAQQWEPFKAQQLPARPAEPKGA
jgi:hypothetical protein